MLAGERAAGVDAGGEDLGGQLLGTVGLALDRAVVEHQRMQVAVARVKHVCDPQAVGARQLTDAMQRAWQRRARHHSILDVVVGADAAHRRERGLAPVPKRRPLGLVGGDPDLGGAVAGVIETGRRISGKRDIRCTVSIGGFVPKPHTPFQWVAQLGAEETDARLAKLREAIKSDKRYGSAIGFRYHDGEPGIVEGLLSRGDRRVGQVIEAVWRDGGRFDGWSEHFSYERWMRCAAEVFDGGPVDVAWYTTREREQSEVLPWDHLDSGLDKDWLWEDWQDALDPDRGRRLPLDAVLRLRCLPPARHRDRGRADRQDAAAADGGQRRP